MILRQCRLADRGVNGNEDMSPPSPPPPLYPPLFPRPSPPPAALNPPPLPHPMPHHPPLPCNQSTFASILYSILDQVKGRNSSDASCQNSTLNVDDCLSESRCFNCMEQNNSLASYMNNQVAYPQVGIAPICASCLYSSPSTQGLCFKCLSWARPSNTDGLFCTKCASLANSPSLGGLDAALQCYDCVVNLDGICTMENSCYDPPTIDYEGNPYKAGLEEIFVCWACMVSVRHLFLPSKGFQLF